MKFGQGLVPVTQALDRGGEVLGDETRVAFVSAPDLVDRLAEILPHLRAQRRRVWPVVGEGEIELQNLGGEGLQRHILAAVDAIGGPDQ